MHDIVKYILAERLDDTLGAAELSTVAFVFVEEFFLISCK